MPLFKALLLSFPNRELRDVHSTMKENLKYQIPNFLLKSSPVLVCLIPRTPTTACKGRLGRPTHLSAMGTELAAGVQGK